MKKLLSILVVAALFTACNSGNTSKSTTDSLNANTKVDSISAIKDSMANNVNTDSSTKSAGVTADTSNLNK